MKKAILAILAVMMIVLLSVTVTLAVTANKRSQETIDRIDAKIERYGK